MPRAPQRQLPQSRWLTVATIRGMRDSTGPLVDTSDTVYAARNVYIPPGVAGIGYVGRPGLEPITASALGSAGVRAGQGGCTWTLANGTRQQVAIVGGRVYTIDIANGTATQALDAATLTAATVTLSSTTRVACVPFGDVLIVSDGVNDPWLWTGATNAGVTRVAIGALYGPPAIHYGKVFALKANRRTMIWSEEGDATTGYDVGGYNNAWDDPGAYNDPMVGVAGTNEALYVFRERSSLTVTGAVNEDFQTAGTRASLSEKIGAGSPWAIVVLPDGGGQNSVMVLDAAARPHVATHGAGMTPMWADCEQTIAMVPRASLVNSIGLYDDATGCVLFGVPGVGQTFPTMWLAFGSNPLRFQAVWTWEEATQAAWSVVDDQGFGRWIHTGNADGRAYLHGLAGQSPKNDDLASGSRYISHQVTTAQLGFDTEDEYRVDQIEAVVADPTQTTISVSYETSRGRSTPQAVPLSGGAGGFVLGTSVLGVGILAVPPNENRARVGTFGRGRWVRLSFTHSEDGEGFSLVMARARGFQTSGHQRVV
jgi:hypothetical protein